MKTGNPRKLVFVSYATADEQEAHRIVGQVEGAGIPCWTAPRDIPPGANYAESIIDAIRHTELMVLLLSEHANESPHVANEVERAVNYRKPIVPVRLVDVKPSRPIELHISTRQWVEMWGSTENRELGMKRLISTLRDSLRDHIPAEVSPAFHPDHTVTEEPAESDYTELELTDHDGGITVLCDPEESAGVLDQRQREGMRVRRGIAQFTLPWSRVRVARVFLREKKDEKGTVVGGDRIVEATLADGRVVELKTQSWCLYGQSEFGEVRVHYEDISQIRVLKLAREAKR